MLRLVYVALRALLQKIDFHDLCLDCFKASYGEIHTYTPYLNSQILSRCISPTWDIGCRQ